MADYTFQELSKENKGELGKTYTYKNEKGHFYIKQALADSSDVLSIEQEYLLLTILNLIGVKTPTEMALLSYSNSIFRQNDQAKEEYFIVKRAVADKEENKQLAPNSKVGFVQDKKWKTPIDLKWAIRDMAINLLFNIKDINIQNTHNSLPIIYPEKNRAAQKFIHFDLLIDKEKLDINANNFFDKLNISHQHVYFDNIHEYLKNVSLNYKKQEEIVKYLQKPLYLLKENKDFIEDLLEQFRPKNLAFVAMLRLKLTHFEDTLNQLSKTFKTKLEVYQPKTDINKYKAKQIPAAFDEEDVENIRKELKISSVLNMPAHFVASQVRKKIIEKTTETSKTERPLTSTKILNRRPNTSNGINSVEKIVEKTEIFTQTQKTKDVQPNNTGKLPPINTKKQS